MIAATDELSVERERFRIIANTVSDVLWDYDLVNQEWWISHDWPEKLGVLVEPAERNARNWFDRVLPEDRAKLMTSFYQLLKSDSERWEVDYRFKESDDILIDILVKATVQRGPDGRVSRMWMPTRLNKPLSTSR